MMLLLCGILRRSKNKLDGLPLNYLRHTSHERERTDSTECRITLTKNDWMMVAMLSGTDEYTFFAYCNMRLHQVLQVL